MNARNIWQAGPYSSGRKNSPVVVGVPKYFNSAPRKRLMEFNLPSYGKLKHHGGQNKQNNNIQNRSYQI